MLWEYDCHRGGDCGWVRSRGVTVSVVSAAEAPELEGVEVLVIGTPTHAFALPTAKSRREAESKYGGTAAAVGVPEWLGEVKGSPGLRAAAFDTAMPGRFVGSAAKRIEKRLRSNGVDVIGRESFTVTGTEGPLLDGELARAEQWGASLVTVEKSPTP